MTHEVQFAQSDSEAEEWISHHEAFVLAYTGRLREARKMSSEASGLAQQAGHRERAALFETGAALREAFFGNAAAACPRRIPPRGPEPKRCHTLPPGLSRAQLLQNRIFKAAMNVNYRLVYSLWAFGPNHGQTGTKPDAFLFADYSEDALAISQLFRLNASTRR